MQEEGMKILGSINLVIKSVIQLAYDLKEYEIRLGHYEKSKSKDKQEQEDLSASIFLHHKEVWKDEIIPNELMDEEGCIRESQRIKLMEFLR
jgi:hypothetical protein